MPVAPFIKPVIKAAGEALVETKPPLSPPVLANSTRTAIASGKRGALVSRVEDAAVKFAGQTIKKQSFRARMANENLSANELKLVDEFIAGKAPLDPVSVDDFGRFLDARGDIPVKAYEGQNFHGVREEPMDFGGPIEPKIHYGPNADTGGPEYSVEVYTVDTPDSEAVSHHFDNVKQQNPDGYGLVSLDLSAYYAHIRKTTAIRKDGKKVTIIHEGQSDKHSRGKKNLYEQKALRAQQAEDRDTVFDITNAIQDASSSPNDIQGAKDFEEYVEEMLREYRSNQDNPNFTRGDQRLLAESYVKQMLEADVPGGRLEGINEEFDAEDLIEILDNGLYNASPGPHLGFEKAVFDRDPKVYNTIANRTVVDSIENGDSELRILVKVDATTEADVLAADAAGRQRILTSSLGRSKRIQENVYQEGGTTSIFAERNPEVKAPGSLFSIYTKIGNKLGIKPRMDNGYLVQDLENIKQPKYIKRLAKLAGISTPLLVALQARAEDESDEFEMASLVGVLAKRALKNTTDAAIRSGKKAALVSTIEDVAFDNSGKSIKAQSFVNVFKNKGVNKQELAMAEAYIAGKAPLDKVSIDDFIQDVLIKRDDVLTSEATGSYTNASVREPTDDYKPGDRIDYNETVYNQDRAAKNPVEMHIEGFEGDKAYGHSRSTDGIPPRGKYTNRRVRIIHEVQSDRFKPGHKYAKHDADGPRPWQELTSGFSNSVSAKDEGLFGFAHSLAIEVHHNPNDKGLIKSRLDQQVRTGEMTQELADKLLPEWNKLASTYDPTLHAITIEPEPRYLANMANSSIVDAINDNQSVVRVRIADHEDLFRGTDETVKPSGKTGVQEWYENDVRNTYTNIANRLGAKVDFDGEYLNIDLDTIVQTPYIKRIAQIAGISTPLLVALQARADDLPKLDENHLRNLIEDGYSDAQILEYQQLLGAQSEADGNRSNFNPIAQGSSAVDLTEAELPPLTKEAYDAQNAQTLNARYNQVFGRGWHLIGGISEGWSDQRQQELENNQAIQAQLFSDLGLNRQYSPTLEAYVLLDSNGREWEIDENLLDSIKASPFEWGLSVVGGVGGFAAGGVVGAPTVVGAPATAVAGSVVGAAALGGVGAGIDQMINAYRIGVHLETADIMSKVGDAAVVNGLFDLATIGTGKVLGTAYKKALKPAYTGTHLFIAKNWKRFMKGDLSATEDLSRAIFSPEVIDNLPQLREDYGKFYKTDDATGLDTFGKPYALSSSELDLRILVDTRPEGVMLAGSIQGQLNTFTRRVADRAKAIQARSSGLAGPEAMIRAQNELILYKQTVENIFENVKDFAALGPNKNGIDYTDYTWDPELAVEPMLLAASKHLDTDRATRQFSSMMASVEDHLETRKFSNLIELRKEIRAFKGNLPKNRVHSHQAVQRALDAIDVEVRRVTEIYMGPEGARTYAIALDTARKTYSEMKTLEKNVLYKALTAKDGRTEKTMRAALIRSLGTTNTDGTYDSVMKAVPASTRYEVEGVAIQVLEAKHTKGDPNGVIGINYPALFDELNTHTWTSSDAKA
ncbi:MAG: hypothetical protein K0U41_03780, partial [Gammaproteobacteria bacterium]|nr:hypothetical protein [Gammaproteobacteria bacterium]